VQFKVPQNIDMADRIVGPLTLVQFLYLLCGGIVVYFLFSTIAPINSTLFFVIGAPVTLFTLALAFLKIQDQPFPKFVGAFFIFLFRPKMRVWFKEGIDPKLTITPDKVENKPDVGHKNIKRSELDRLALALDTGGHIPHHPEQVAPATPSLPTRHPENRIKKSRPVLDNVRKK
jgi:hypothetical protein